jgi:hypothetical protein
VLASQLLRASEGLAKTAPVGDLPELDTAVNLTERLAALRGLLAGIDTAVLQRKAAAECGRQEKHAIASAGEQYAKVLLEAGKCPTCGQRTDIGHNHLPESVGT